MRRRVLIARFGLVAAALVVVWVILDARASTSAARRQLADQSNPTRAGSLAYRLAEAESSRAELVAELEATRGDLAGLGDQVDKLPTRFPTPAPAPRTAPPPTYVTVEPGKAGTFILRPVQPPTAGKPSPTPTSSPRPAPSASPTPTSPPCLVALFGVGVCPDG
jgi:hypothetical protein